MHNDRKAIPWDEEGEQLSEQEPAHPGENRSRQLTLKCSALQRKACENQQDDQKCKQNNYQRTDIEDGIDCRQGRILHIRIDLLDGRADDASNGVA